MTDERTFNQHTPSSATSCEDLTIPLHDIVGTEGNELAGNRIPIVAPNVFDPLRYLAGSVIIGLSAVNPSPVVVPKILASAKSGELLIVADVDVETAEELRKERLMDSRSRAHTGLEV